MITLDIPECIPSLNRFLGAHWRRKHRERAKWGWLVKAALLDARQRPGGQLAVTRLREHVALKGRVSVRVQVWRARRFDETNLEGGFKFAEDALKAEGLIVDDHPKWIDRPPILQRVGPERTVILLDYAP